MASQVEKEGVIKTIHSHIEYIISTNVEEEIIREGFLGKELNFSEIRNPINDIINYIKKISVVDLTVIPFSNLTSLRDVLDTLHDLFKQIKNFKATTDNATNQRNYFIQNINNNLDQLIQYSIPVLFVGNLFTDDTANEKEKLNTILQDFDSHRQQVENKSNEINAILESAKSAVGKVGVNVHATLFEKESIFHKNEANKWLKNVGVVIILIIIGGLAALKMMPSFDNAAFIIQYSVTKIVVIATMFYALSICMKNYRAHKHNEIVNKHRQNALSTFETFVNSSAEQQTKDAVLLQATMSIFSNQQTGYSSSDNDGDMPSKVIEIIKSAAPVAKGQ